MTQLKQFNEHLECVADYDMDSYDRAKLEALLFGYFYKYSSQDWVAVDVERDIQVELDVKPYQFVGKIDTLITDDSGQLVMLEHKTTAESLDDLTKPYFRKLAYDLQISAYHMAQFLMEEELSHTIYDVVHKPRIRPRKLKKADVEEIESGSYCEFPLKVELEVEVGDQEPPVLYKIRLLNEILRNPDKYYLRYDSITRTSEECVATWKFLNEIAEDIVHCKTNDRWHQNTSACSKYNTPCEYMDLCCNVGNPDDTNRWRAREGSNLSAEHNLSVSGIQCFLTCKRKYYWRYVRRIERNRTTEPLALTFGSAFHECLESFWNSLRREKR